ncbi:MAG: hypothetical protein JXA44_10985 [Methanospirillaceae archaeon]|nr:hypothetical protein [Methanospirillaceae archaeon]
MTEHDDILGETIPKRRPNTTGISGLDLALDGGYPAGTVILLIGSACSGIEYFANQFWRAGKGKRELLMIDGYLEEGMVDARFLTPDQIFLPGEESGIIIDSLSTIILQYGIEPVLEGIDFTRENARQSGDHAFFILYSGMHDTSTEIILMRRSDIVIQLHEQMHGSEVVRILEIKKITGFPLPKRALPFLIRADGIELSTTSRVV